MDVMGCLAVQQCGLLVLIFLRRGLIGIEWGRFMDVVELIKTLCGFNRAVVFGVAATTRNLAKPV